MRLCRNSFYGAASLFRPFKFRYFQTTDFRRFLENIRFSGDKVRAICINRPKWGVFTTFLARFAIFEHIST